MNNTHQETDSRAGAEDTQNRGSTDSQRDEGQMDNPNAQDQMNQDPDDSSDTGVTDTETGNSNSM